jgi:inorganic pyrophosphatase
MSIKALPPYGKGGAVHALIEIPTGGRNKYEYDPELDIIALDRTLYGSVHFPTEYGFVPGTLSSDGDPLDVLVMVGEPTFPGCLLRVRLLGVLTVDDGGQEPKLLAVPVEEPRFEGYADIRDVPPHLLTEIENFFTIYTQLEGKKVKALGWQGAKQATKALDAAILRRAHTAA